MAIKRIGPTEIRDERQLAGNSVGSAVRYIVHVVVDGMAMELAFDHNPTDDEVLAQVPPMQDLNPTLSRTALLPIMKERIFEASQFDWFNTKAQADGALTAAQKTAVANLNTTIYQRARAAVAAWYGAT